METHTLEQLGPLFAFDKVEELDLMVDLLAQRKDDLAVFLASVSYLQRFPQDTQRLRPATRQQIAGSLSVLLASSRGTAAAARTAALA